MAESSLSIGLPDLRQEVGGYLGYGRTVASFNTAQAAVVDSIVNSGVRRVYYPPANGQGKNAHEWSFLRPSGTLTMLPELVRVSGTDGTVATTTFDDVAGTDWSAQSIDTDTDVVVITNGSAGVTDGTYNISVVIAGSITLSTSPGTGTCSYSINRVSQHVYDLPDDFGRLVGGLHYAADEHRAEITQVSVSDILEMRAAITTTQDPHYAAVRYKTSTGSTGQRQEILLYPQPSEAYVLTYEYEAYNGTLSDSYPYPLGGMQYAELYIASCLAVAESRLNDETGQHNADFTRLLVDAIGRDCRHGAKNYGQMGHRETPTPQRRIIGSGYDITYDGVTW